MPKEYIYEVRRAGPWILIKLEDFKDLLTRLRSTEAFEVEVKGDLDRVPAKIKRNGVKAGVGGGKPKK